MDAVRGSSCKRILHGLHVMSISLTPQSIPLLLSTSYYFFSWMVHSISHSHQNITKNARKWRQFSKSLTVGTGKEGHAISVIRRSSSNLPQQKHNIKLVYFQILPTHTPVFSMFLLLLVNSKLFNTNQEQERRMREIARLSLSCNPCRVSSVHPTLYPRLFRGCIMNECCVRACMGFTRRKICACIVPYAWVCLACYSGQIRQGLFKWAYITDVMAYIACTAPHCMHAYVNMLKL
jgi:hypothetical protein